MPQVPWTAPTRRRTSRAPQSAGSAHLVGRRHREALRCLGPPARARAEAAGGGGGKGRRRGMARWCVPHPPPPPRQLTSPRAGRLHVQRRAVSCRLLTATRAAPLVAPAAASRWRLAPSPAPPGPTPPSSSASPRDGRAVRAALHEPPLSSPQPSGVVAPQPAPATALDARQPSSRRSLAAALRGRGVCSAAVVTSWLCGRAAQLD